MTKKKKRLISILLIAAMLVSLVACGGETAKKEETTVDEGPQTHLRVAIDVEPGSMWPLSGTSSGGGLHVHRQIYDTLIQFGADFEILPCLAKSWEQVDSLHYRFHLNENVKDSAGNTITASDALFSMYLYSQSGEHCQTVRYIDIENSVAEDDNTLLVALNDPNAFQFQNIAKVKIIDQQAYEKDPEAFIANPVGCGPYKVTEYIPGSKIVMTYNENYYGEKPQITDITFYVMTEPSQRTSALETGEIDLDMSLQSSDFDYVNGLSNCDSFSLVSNRAEGMWLNTSSNSVLGDINLRKAVALAIDNAAVCSVVYKNMYSPAKGACAESLTDYDPSYDNELYAKQDLAEAKKLVEAAGATGKELVILTTGRSDQVLASEQIMTWLKEIGFDASIQQMEDAVINDALSNPAGGWDIGMTNFRCGSNYMLDMYNAYLSYLNYCAWSGPNYEKFLETSTRGCTSTDTAEIKECTTGIINLIQDDIVLYNFAITKQFIGKNAKLVMGADQVYGSELYAPVIHFEK